MNCSKYQDKSTLNISKIETDALFTFAQKYLPEVGKYDLMGHLIQSGTNLKHRVAFVVDELMKKSKLKFDAEDLREAAYAFAIKSQLVEEYMCEAKKNVRSKLPLHVTLIKAAKARSELEDLLEDCFFSVEKLVIGCDQRSMLEGIYGVNVAMAMNRSFIDFLCEESSTSLTPNYY